MTQPLLQAADLRGAARLSSDAVEGLATLVEAMQVPRSGAARPSDLAAAAAHEPLRPEREAVIAALNGVLGDHLAATGNALAITMAFRRAGRPLQVERAALRSRLAGATPRLLVLLHDLCLNDLQWRRADHDHGAALAREAGYTPVYLHYNSGLSVSTNGRILAPLMERLYDAWPMPIERLAMLGHGMGGLVARSAIHHGMFIQRGGLRWPTRVNDLVCLGTPHHGAALDGSAKGLSLLLGATPQPPGHPGHPGHPDHPAHPVLARLGRLRSAGIEDLRLGNVVSAPGGDDGTQRGATVGLPDRTRCFAIAARLGQPAGGARARLASDGLVPVASALGRHREPGRDLGFAAEHQAVVPDTGHLDLLASASVSRLLQQWLG